MPDTSLPTPQAVGWQRIEGGLIFLAAMLLFWHSDATLGRWTALMLFFVPDLSFLGYCFGARIGAYCYNTAHLYAVGVVLLAAGVLASLPGLYALGSLWLAHCGFDRMLGYGLKSAQAFTLTHLGVIGRK